MVVRSILVTVTLFVLWSITIRWLPQDMKTGQGLWSENQIAAEDYLAGPVSGERYVALLGSSLSQLLPLDSARGMPVYNLGLSGQGVGDGLNLLAAGRPPAIILIETNIILKEDNEDFQQVTGNQLSRFALRNLPGLQHKNQPVGVVFGLARFWKQGKQTEVALSDRSINESSLENKRKEYADLVPESEIRSRLETLRDRLRPLENTGSKVVFFEAPIHPGLCNSPRAQSIRAGVKTIFQPPAYVYIPQPNCNDYSTTDGHHLGNKSGAAFASWLKHELEQL